MNDGGYVKDFLTYPHMNMVNVLLNEYGYMLRIIEVLPCMLMIELYDASYTCFMKFYQDSMKNIF